MSAEKNNIPQIRNYLEGKLDARAMHRLEREAQDDPFLMDAIEGYEQTGKIQENALLELKTRLAHRVAEKPIRSIILWRVLPIAASVILMLGAGYLFFKPSAAKKQYVAAVSTDTSKNPDKTSPLSGEKIAAAPKQYKYRSMVKPTVVLSHADMLVAEAPPIDNNLVYKADTVTYKPNAYAVRKNAKIDELLKKTEGMQIDSNGNLLSQGKPITKARINGKDYVGGDVNQAVQNLPADILTKIQVIDDYGDQAGKTGIKNGEPNKILNIKTDTLNRGLIAANRPNQLKRSVDNGIDKDISHSLNEVAIVQKSSSADCQENIAFKNKFFGNIAVVETYTTAQTTGSVQTVSTKKFIAALTFITNHTHTASLAKVAGYRIGYVTPEDLKTDKGIWTSWYNANKCNDLK